MNEEGVAVWGFQDTNDDTYGGHPGGILGRAYGMVARPLLASKAPKPIPATAQPMTVVAST